ncbi:MAG: hypothetical protein ACI9VR_002671, partial [Cognaticolwellia sp.]
MEFKHMFRALVLSSGVSAAAGCAAKDVSSTNGAAAATGVVEKAAESEDDVVCEEIC